MHILTAVGADARVGGHESGAAWTLHGLHSGLATLEEVHILDHEVARRDGKGELYLHVSLGCG